MVGRENAVRSAMNYRKLRAKGFTGAQDSGLLDRHFLHRTCAFPLLTVTRFRSFSEAPRPESLVAFRHSRNKSHSTVIRAEISEKPPYVGTRRGAG